VTIDFYPADVGRDIVSNGGIGTITAYIDAQHVTVNVTQPFLGTLVDAANWNINGTPQTTLTPSASTPVGATVTLTLGLAGFRPEDAGKYITINGGLIKIVAIASSTSATGTIQTELTSVATAPAFAWTLQASVWGGVNGYPRCGTLHEQRLWVAGSLGFPQTVWGSISGQYLNFQLGVFDDQAMSYIIASAELNPIMHLAESRGLLALTYGGEFSIRGGSDKAITPTSLQVNSQSVYGTSNVAPERIGNEVYFVQRSGRKLRAMAQNQYNTDQYGSPDLSILAEHATLSGVTDLAFQQEPSPRLFATRNDGQMATLTIDRDQDVIAWTRQTTQGLYESCESVPTSDGDAVFVVVLRLVNGVSTRYIERFDNTLLTDAAITGASVNGSTVWSGLGHLEGRTVNVKADGIVLANRIVVGGSITIERPAFAIEIGLNYITTIKTLTPEIAGQEGSAQGGSMSINRVIVRLRDTIGCNVNYQQLPFIAFGNNILDQAPVPFTGDKPVFNYGWGGGFAQTIIQQTKPYPLHLLSVIVTLTVNQG
jgi:hypothetical protein